MLSAQDLRGMYAIPPTPAKPRADRWDATDTVDLDEAARFTERLIQDGVSGFMVLGTTGECATQPDEHTGQAGRARKRRAGARPLPPGVRWHDRAGRCRPPAQRQFPGPVIGLNSRTAGNESPPYLLSCLSPAGAGRIPGAHEAAAPTPTW
jgi:hypothetical protein